MHIMVAILPQICYLENTCSKLLQWIKNCASLCN